jgi:peptidoglycan/LPS O-acetylase OafA/YrhL
MIAVATVVVNKGRHFPGWWALLPTLGATLLISAGPEGWVNRKFLSSRFLVWFGLISYPLYLWHWPLLSFSYTSAAPAQPPVAMRIAAIAAGVALAWITYRFVERPIRSGAHGKATAMALWV